MTSGPPLSAARRAGLEKQGWTVVAWAADAHDSLEFSFKRADRTTVVLLTASFTSTLGGLTLVSAERWTYFEREAHHATILTRLLTAPLNDDAVLGHIEQVINQWDSPAAPSSGDEYQLSPGSAESPSLTMPLQLVGKEQDGVVRLEKLGSELAEELAKLARWSWTQTPLQDMAGGRSGLLRSGALLWVAVVASWTLLLVGIYGNVLPLAGAIGTALLTALGIVLGCLSASRGLLRHPSTDDVPPSIASVILPGLETVGVAILTAFGTSIALDFGEDLTTGAITAASLNVLIAAGVVVGTAVDAKQATLRRSEVEAVVEQRRLATTEVFLARAREVRAANLREQTAVLEALQQGATTWVGVARRADEIVEAPTARWYEEAERERRMLKHEARKFH